MKKVRTLVVDDSAVFRSQIRVALEGLDGAECVGTVSNGALALEFLKEQTVDLITLDLEMPKMGGLEMLRELKKIRKAPKVIIFSSYSERGADITLEALALGASDFVLKPASPHSDIGLGVSSPSKLIRALLEPKISELFPHLTDEASPSSSSRSREPNPNLSARTYPPLLWDLVRPKVIVIASSTGGPEALEKIFSFIKGPVRCPILIVQHMPPIFTATLAERLAKLSGIPAAEARSDEVLAGGRIYVAPGDFHMGLEASGSDVRIVLDQGPRQNFVRPAADILFSSAARVFRDRTLGIVLTGMGEDGRLGSEAIKRAGGAVLIQSRETCAVFGMPGAVFDSGAYDRVEDLIDIGKTLSEKAAA